MSKFNTCTFVLYDFMSLTQSDQGLLLYLFVHLYKTFWRFTEIIGHKSLFCYSHFLIDMLLCSGSLSC